VGAIVQRVVVRAFSTQLISKPIVDAAKGLTIKIAASYTRLIRDHNHPISSLSQRSEPFSRTGNQLHQIRVSAVFHINHQRIVTVNEDRC